MLKYVNPEATKVEAYQYYQTCVDKYARTKHSKDYIELIRARKDYTNKAQYARNHHPDILLNNTPSLHVLIEQQDRRITKLEARNAQLRKALSVANHLLAKYVTLIKLDDVDNPDHKVIQNLN